MTPLTILAHLGVGFVGFLIGTIVMCIILVKKNGNRYTEIKEDVRKARYGSADETSEEETEDDTDTVSE